MINIFTTEHDFVEYRYERENSRHYSAYIYDNSSCARIYKTHNNNIIAEVFIINDTTARFQFGSPSSGMAVASSAVIMVNGKQNSQGTTKNPMIIIKGPP
jgi:hypothetical protein